MRRMKWEWVALCGILLLAAFPCAAQKIKTTSDSSFDFKSSKHYAWGKNHIITRQGKKNDALIDQKIVEEVNRNLAAKGFTEDAQNPDFYVWYDAGAGDMAVGFEGEQGGQPAVSTTTVGPVYGIPENMWYSVEGQVTFHVAEAKSKKAVWTTVATKKIRDPNKAMKDMPNRSRNWWRRVSRSSHRSDGRDSGFLDEGRWHKSQRYGREERPASRIHGQAEDSPTKQ